jgi:hypothetical protein
MKKAVAKPARPFNRRQPPEHEWEREIASFDRNVRRWNKKFKDHVVRIDHGTVRLITSDRKLNLDLLNALSPVREEVD